MTEQREQTKEEYRDWAKLLENYICNNTIFLWKKPAFDDSPDRLWLFWVHGHNTLRVSKEVGRFIYRRDRGGRAFTGSYNSLEDFSELWGWFLFNREFLSDFEESEVAVSSKSSKTTKEEKPPFDLLKNCQVSLSSKTRICWEESESFGRTPCNIQEIRIENESTMITMTRTEALTLLKVLEHLNL